jgi:hypothetical protein
VKSRPELAAVRLRDLALEGRDAEELLEHAVSALCGELTPFSFIAALRIAFGVPLKFLRDIEGWEGLGLPGNTVQTEQVALTNRPYLASFRERQNE